MEKKNLTMAYMVLKKEPHRAYEKGRMRQTHDKMSRENTLYTIVFQGADHGACRGEDVP